MTPKSIDLARELVESALFDARVRRSELMRQAKSCRTDAEAKPLWSEANRQGQRIRRLRVLDAELEALKFVSDVDPFS